MKVAVDIPTDDIRFGSEGDNDSYFKVIFNDKDWIDVDCDNINVAIVNAILEKFGEDIESITPFVSCIDKVERIDK